MVHAILGRLTGSPTSPHPAAPPSPGMVLPGPQLQPQPGVSLSPAGAATYDVSVSPVRPRLRGYLGLGVLMSAMAVGTGLLLPGLDELPPTDYVHRVPGWFLGLLFFASATVGFHIRARRGAYILSLSEVPLVLGLAAAAPLQLVLARAVSEGAVLVLYRRQRGLKLAFNLCWLALGTCLAVGVYHLVLAGEPASGPRGWLAALVAVVAVDACGAVLVSAAIALTADPAQLRRLPSAVLAGVVPTCVNACLGLVTLLTVERQPWAGLLLLVVVGVAAVAYRSYEAESVSHARVERLYSFTRTTGAAVETDAVVSAVLSSVRDQLRTEDAELALPAMDGGSWQRVRLSGTSDLGIESLDADPDRQWWSEARRGGTALRPDPLAPKGPVTAIAVPLPLEAETFGALMAYGRLSDVPAFTTEDLRLLETMGNHAGMVLAHSRGVERLRRQAAEQEHNALHDALTGLPNRRYFSSELEGALTRYDGRLVAVALMDLDGFKEINDTLGHDIGDRLLVEVGARLRAAAAGFVARLGGDEFALLITSAANEAALRHLLLDVLARVEAPFELNALTHHVRASVGVALAPTHGTQARVLLARADVAMYGAKASRRRIELYRPEYDRNSHRRLTLLGSLGTAIDAGEITLAYQPKLAAGDLRLVGVEALARWQHPVLGPVGPEEFIPLAEHTGLIRPLTLLVLETALRQRASWSAQGRDLSVAVNLSTRNLLDATLPDDIARLLRRTGVPASALTLEITESGLLSEAAVSLRVLERLVTLGVTLSVDDFGTGYSSLAYLHSLPFHEIKIDRSFVLGLASEARHRSIVRAIVALAHELRLPVVAEGVETVDALRFLQQQGCDVVQGYLFAPAMPTGTFEQWAAQRSGGRLLGAGSRAR